MDAHNYVRRIDEIDGDDATTVGGKSANLGELAGLDVPTLPGFSTTVAAYDAFLESAGLKAPIHETLADVDASDVEILQDRGARVRRHIREATLPDELREAIEAAYGDLAADIGVDDPVVAVRSSATAEDQPEASFAGQQETFLNVRGAGDLVDAVKRCYASLFTDRAISYREDRGISHFDVKLSVLVQEMGRADRGAAGVMFTIDPDSGFDGVVVIEAGYGLGGPVVQGEVTPDAYVVFKETNGIVEKTLGEKATRLVSGEDGTEREPVPKLKRQTFALTDEQIKELSTYAKRIESHFGEPQDVEWLYDGQRGELFVVQTRPETVHAAETGDVLRTYRMTERGEVAIKGSAIGDGIGTGTVRVLEDADDMHRFEQGDVLVASMTDPDWEPVMKKAAAIVTDKGGKTSHAAIVSRELGVPAIVGSGYATRILPDGESVTVDCTSSIGRVYDGILEYDVVERAVDDIPETDTDVTLILGDPSMAFHHASLPVDGVGLAREEFIVASHVGEHPLSLLDDGRGDEYVQALRSGIARFAAAFYPEQVTVRLSDFTSAEYRELGNGTDYEPHEDNPALGWRGAARYYDDAFEPAFALECEALRQVRDDVGLDNVAVMVPFVRTPEEGKRVIDLLAEYGLDDLEVSLMAELPTNVLRAPEFAEHFDGFSIGTNDLTQLILGVDRNSEKLGYLFDENDPAVRESVRELVDAAHAQDSRIGICGDAPSTVDRYVEFLVDAGIDSIAVSPDVAIETILTVASAEGTTSEIPADD